MRTIYFHHTGPMIRYESGVLYVNDLNPEMKTKWRMNRVEMLRMAWRCFVAAIARAKA